MPDDTTPDPEIERKPEAPPKRKPWTLDDLPQGSDWGPRLADLPLPEDYGIPGIDLDKRGQFKVPIFKMHKPQADRFLLEQAKSEFFMGMNMDVPTPIAWLWPGHIAIGKLTLIEGESNSGTSFLVTDMAARVTRRSPWPGAVVSSSASSQPRDPGISAVAESAGIQPSGNCPNSGESGYPKLLPPASHVLFVNGGDNIGDTLTPRLINSRANLAEITVLSGIDTHDPAVMQKGKADTNRRLVLPADLGHIEYQLRQHPDTRLVVVDSLSDFCRTDKQFRETVRGLHEMAERCNVAVVATARPKNDRRARSKLTPSADRRSESVRCVLNVLVDPHDRTQRYLAPARMNFCREPQWLPFRIGEGVIEWGQQLAAAPVYQRNSPADQEKVTLLHEAMECLEGTLAHGDLSAKIAIKQVMGCGFSKGTIIRARRALGVRSIRQGWGPHGTWIWTLKKAGAGAGAGAGNGEANGTGENGNGENGNGAEADNRHDMTEGKGRPRESSPAEEFGEVDFEHLPRALVLEALNRLRVLEGAAMGEALPNGKPAKEGKRSKNGKRKPR